MNNKLSKIALGALIIAGILVGCTSNTEINADSSVSEESSVSSNSTESAESAESTEKTEIVVLAAASLTDVCNDIEKIYEENNPDIDLNFSYGSSGALQTQIEEGAPADVFISAASKQMNALKDEELVNDETVVDLLENKVVLIVPKDSDNDLTSFEDIADDSVSIVGLGEPSSVPVGQYSEEIFTSLGILDKVKEKANYGSDVRTVLSWVEEGEVDCGVVYATDAYVSDKVEIVCEAPDGSYQKVIYPAGVIKASEHVQESQDFLDYLNSKECSELFESYGFSTVD